MSGFLFLRPWWLLALLLVPLLLFPVWRRGRGGGSPWRCVVDAGLLEALLVAPGGEESRRRWRSLLPAVAWILAVLILAGPSWQRLPPLRFQPAAPPLALLVELSDAVEGAELERMRALVTELLERLPPRPVSFWVYNHRAWRVMPASRDLSLLQRLVAVLEPSLLPGSGRSPGAALARVAADQARRGPPGEILLVATGATERGVEEAGRLSGSGYRILALSPGGREDSLCRLGKAGRGGCFSGTELERLVAALAPREYRRAEGNVDRRPVDDGPWLLLPLLALLFFLFRRGAVLLCLVLVLPLPPAHAGWRALFLNPDQQGWRELVRGDPAAAASRFRDPLWRGIALYRAGEYEAAARLFERLESPLARYNLGNARVMLGDLEGARRAYLSALELDPGMEDARYNLRLVEQVLAGRQEGRKNNVPGLRPRGRPRPGRGKGGTGRVPTPPPPGIGPGGREGGEEGASGKGGKRKRGSSSGASPAPGGKKPPGGRKGGAETRKGDAGRRPGGAGRKPGRGATPAGKGMAGGAPGADVARREGLPPGESGPKGEEKGNRDRETAGRGIPGEEAATPPGRSREEALRAREIWLESIRDDPAGLLRAIFRQQLREGGP